jgi:putative oxidoreductase
MKAIIYILAAIFALSGGAKLAGLEFEIEAFTRWGYPLWFMYATGAAEVAGAVALLVQRLSALAAAALTALMVGALGTHVIHAEWGMLAIAAVIFALSAWRAWQGRGDLGALLRWPAAARA